MPDRSWSWGDPPAELREDSRGDPESASKEKKNNKYKITIHKIKQTAVIVPGSEGEETLVEDGPVHGEAPVELHKTGPDTSLAEAPPEK